jgi:pilus assembly protein Flp/PilA
MWPGILKLVFNLQRLLTLEEGQDLVEYALVIALIAFGSTAGMKVLATAISNEFATISAVLSNALA